MNSSGRSVLRLSPTVRRVVSVAVVVVILVAMTTYVGHHGSDFVASWRRIGPRGAIGATGLGVLGVGATWLQWHALLSGMGVRLRPRASARVFFLSQLGKYVPGSVWPLVLQAESVRRHGGSRKVAIAANVVALSISLTTGLVFAGALLPASAPDALARYWWALAALPLLAVVIHPSGLTTILDRIWVALGRQPLSLGVPPKAILSAMAWSSASWIALGLQTYVLAHALGASGWSTLALSLGGTALAVCAGILFLPAPAGAGAREVVLLLVLGTVLTTGAATAIVLASRLAVVFADLALAAVAAATALGGERSRDPNGLSN